MIALVESKDMYLPTFHVFVFVDPVDTNSKAPFTCRMDNAKSVPIPERHHLFFESFDIRFVPIHG